MTKRATLALVVGFCGSTIPVSAMPADTITTGTLRDAGTLSDAMLVRVSEKRRIHRHSRVPQNFSQAQDQRLQPSQDYGGYVVNQYGYGNYVGGPGGFGGYPAASGAAFVYRQQQNWKCEYAPETC